jgi:uncharacterized lipoprotein NlpE involved in copper resistance
MRIAVLVSIALVGCASQQQPTMTWDEALPSLSNYDVCEAVLMAPPDYAEPAQEEALRRKVNCADYAQAIAIQRGMNAARQQDLQNQARENGRRILSTPQPRLGTNCTSTMVGGVLQSSCY